MCLSYLVYGHISGQCLKMVGGMQVANFLVGLMFLHLLETLGAGILYTFFTMVCLAAALFVKKNVLETKGRSLEEIESLLLDNL